MTMSPPPRDYPPQGYVFDPDDVSIGVSIEDVSSEHSSSFRELMQRASTHPTVAAGTRFITGVAGTAIEKGQRAAGIAQDKGKELAEKAKEKGQYAVEKGKEKGLYAVEIVQNKSQGLVDIAKGKELAEKAKEKGQYAVEKGKEKGQYAVEIVQNKSQGLVDIAKEKGPYGAVKVKEYVGAAPVVQGTASVVKDLYGALEDRARSLWRGSTVLARSMLAHSLAWWLSRRAGHFSLLSSVRPGSVLQLVSRVAGGTVQIVLDSEGRKMLDARGPLDTRAFNTLWTVVASCHPQSCRLVNHGNYIAVEDGRVKVVNMTGPPGPDTELRLETSSVTVRVSFTHHPGLVLAFYKTGELRAADDSQDEEANAFGLKLVKGPP